MTCTEEHIPQSHSSEGAELLQLPLLDLYQGLECSWPLDQSGRLQRPLCRLPILPNLQTEMGCNFNLKTADMGVFCLSAFDDPLISVKLFCNLLIATFTQTNSIIARGERLWYIIASQARMLWALHKTNKQPVIIANGIVQGGFILFPYFRKYGFLAREVNGQPINLGLTRQSH